MRERRLSIRPALTLKGRRGRGLAGYEGKPFHPPLTDIPIAAYVLTAVFDLISMIGRNQTWGRDFYRAATFTLIAGAVVSLMTAFTGYLDWRTTERGSQVRRTANAHAWTMIIVTLLVLANIGLRWFNEWGAISTPAYLLALSAVTTVLVSIGSALGGSLVFEHGFNVENAMDHPVWHPSVADYLPEHRKSA